MTSEEYIWKQNAQVNLDAQEVGRLFKKIAKMNKGLTPALVVEHAKPKNSLLHGYFTWDDKLAGHNWRLTQARYLIRQLVVVKVVDGDRPEPVRAFLSVKKEVDEGAKKQFAYFTVTDAIRNKSYRQQILDDALREIRAWRMKYSRFQELANIFDAIDAIDSEKLNGTNGKQLVPIPITGNGKEQETIGRNHKQR